MAGVVVDVGGHVAWVDVVDHDVIPRVGLHLPGLYPGEGTPAYLGHEVRVVQPSLGVLATILRGGHEVLHESVEILLGERGGGESLGELLGHLRVAGGDTQLRQTLQVTSPQQT